MPRCCSRTVGRTASSAAACSSSRPLRYNSIAATLPIVVLLFDWGYTHWRRYLVAVAVWVAITVGGLGINRTLTQHHEHAWHSSVAIFDLVGMLRYTRDYPDAAVERDLAGTPLAVHDNIRVAARKRYTPRFHWWMWHDDGRIFDPPTTQAHRDAIKAAWVRLVTTKTSSYLRHRWKVFQELLGITGHGLIAPVWEGFVEAEWHVDLVRAPSRYSLVQRKLLKLFTWASTTWLFMPRMYLLLALALLPLCRSRLSLTFMLSGLFYQSSLFIAAPSADWRYSHWMIVTTIVAAIVAFVDRRATGVR